MHEPCLELEVMGQKNPCNQFLKSVNLLSLNLHLVIDHDGIGKYPVCSWSEIYTNMKSGFFIFVSLTCEELKDR